MKDGGPAFPQYENWPFDESDYTGISVRDYFAGQALLGLVASDSFNIISDDPVNECAKVAYAIAAAMLKAREES